MRRSYRLTVYSQIHYLDDAVLVEGSQSFKVHETHGTVSDPLGGIRDP